MNIDEKMELLAGLITAYAEAKADFEANTAEAREMIQNLEAEITAADRKSTRLNSSHSV